MSEMEPRNTSLLRAGRLIATEEAFITRGWLDAVDELSPSGLSAGDLRFINTLRQIPMWFDGLIDWDKRLADMDANGLDMQLLSLCGPGVQIFEPDVGAALSVKINDELAEIVASHPTRFAGLGAVAPQNPDAAAREIERIAKVLKLGGIIINSHTNDAFLDEPQFDSVLAAAAQHKMPIYLHPRGPAPSMVKPYLDYGLMAATWGFAADAGVHAMRMIMGGVFDRHPNLTIVLGHMGEAIPFFINRMDYAYATAQQTGKAAEMRFLELKKKPSDYFRENFYITNSGMPWHDVLDYCINAVSIDRILFAVDYPFHATDHAVDFMRAAPLGDDDWNKIAHGNAERVFNIASLSAQVPRGDLR